MNDRVLTVRPEDAAKKCVCKVCYEELTPSRSHVSPTHDIQRMKYTTPGTVLRVPAHRTRSGAKCAGTGRIVSVGELR